MPASMSVGRADALAEREARLVDELGDDPAEHEARARRRPTRRGARARRRSARRPRARRGAVVGVRVSSTSAAERRQRRGSRRSGRRGPARRAARRRTAAAAGRPAAAGRRSPPQSTISAGSSPSASSGVATSQPAPARGLAQLGGQRALARDHDQPVAAAGLGRRPGRPDGRVAGSRTSPRRSCGRGGPAATIAARRAARAASAARRRTARRTTSRPRSRRRCRRGPSARTGPSGSRRRAGRCGRPAPASRAAPATSRSASSAERAVAAVDEEAGAVGGVDHVLAHRLAGRAGDAPAPPRPSARPATTSTSCMTGGGLKKCMPTTRSGPRHAGGERGHAQRRGVGGEHAVGARRPRRARANSSRLSSRRSGAASITRPAGRERAQTAAGALERAARLALAARPRSAARSSRPRGCRRRRARAPRGRGRAAARARPAVRRQLGDPGAHRPGAARRRSTVG